MNSVFGQSLQMYYGNLAKECFAARKKMLSALSTRDEALAYIRTVREKIAPLFSNNNSRQTEERPPRIISKRKMEWGTLENLVFYTPANGPVSANLYLPELKGGKLPAILQLCGHNDDGKAAPTYQRQAIFLARTGFAVLVIDPIGQGDRRQFKHLPEFSGRCWDEHSYIGRRLFLLGEWLGARMVQDAVSAIDYLETRPEIDISHLGVTGTSGGGTAATFLAAVEKRIKMLAPVCYITSWKRNIFNERPTDNEQIPPYSLALHLDIADFLIARAPVPTLICGKENDFFDARGTRQAFQELSQIHALLGKENSVELFMDEGGHGLSLPTMKKCCDFFARHAGLSPVELPDEPEILTEKKLSCGELPETLDPHIQYTLQNHPSVKADLATALHIKLPLSVPEYHVLREVRLNNAVFSRFGLPDAGVIMSVLFCKDSNSWYHLPTTAETVTLYVAETDAKTEMAALPCGSWGIDLRGVGEVTPTSCYQGSNADIFTLNGADYFYSALGLQLDVPFLGGKVHDLLMAVSLLSASGKRVKLIARGTGCIPAQLAARLSTEIESIELQNPPANWQETVLQELPALPQSAMLFGGVGKNFC